MGTVDLKSIDRRTITVRFPLAGAELGKLGDMLTDAASSGYRLESTANLMGGSQRDDYAVGVTLTLARGIGD